MGKPVKLKRLSGRPILEPRPEVAWECGAVLNTAAVQADGKVHLFYRAIRHDGKGSGTRWSCYDTTVGHAVSSDGIRFDRLEPVIPYGFDGGLAAEDCRVSRIGGRYYMTYCQYDKAEGIPRAGYAVSDDLYHWDRKGVLVPYEECGFNKNAVLFPGLVGGRYALFHRPESAAYRQRDLSQFDWWTWARSGELADQEQPGITLSYSDDLKCWSDTRVIMQPRRGFWDDMKVGPGAPPILTPRGWLNVYHGVSSDKTYRLGIAIHAAKDPSIVLERQAECIIEPELEWEREGDVPNVIFTCGALLIGRRLVVYYGGADKRIGVAEADVGDFAGL